MVIAFRLGLVQSIGTRAPRLVLAVGDVRSTLVHVLAGGHAVAWGLFVDHPKPVPLRGGSGSTCKISFGSTLFLVQTRRFSGGPVQSTFSRQVEGAGGGSPPHFLF